MSQHASSSASSMQPRRMLSPSTPQLVPGRPNHLMHNRSISHPVVPLAAVSTRHSSSDTPDDAGHGKFIHSVKKSLRVSRRLSTKGTASYSDSEPEHSSAAYAPPLSSVPPPTIQEIMMGLHLSRTPHLAQPRAARTSAPPSVVVSEHDSPAPPFLFALMRSRAESAGASTSSVHRRASAPAASTASTSKHPPSANRPRVPLPPPPKRSSLKKTSTNSSDSSIPTTPGGTRTSGSPNGRGTPSPSLSSLSSSRHQLRTPSKLRFSTLFRPAHRRDKDREEDAVVAPAHPPARKAVRFSPSYGGLQNAASGGLENVREVATPVSDSPPVSPSQPTAPPPVAGAKRQQFVRRVSGRAKATAKEVFAVIADPSSRR